MADTPWTAGEMAGFAGLLHMMATIIVERKPELLGLTPNEMMLLGIKETAGYLCTNDDRLSPEGCAELSYIEEMLANVLDVMGDLRAANAL